MMGALKIDRAAQVRAQGVVRVAAALGVQVYEHSRTLACPACGALRRSSSGEDKRGPVGLRDGLGWRCHRCSESGDALTLAAWIIAGKAKPNDWAPVWARLADLGLCEALADAPARPRQPYRPPTPQQPLPAPKGYPPAGEPAALYEGDCVPVLDDAPACAYFRERWPSGRLDPGLVEETNTAKVLRLDAPERFPWARRGGHSWQRAPQAWRLISRLYDFEGVLRSVHARALTPSGSADKAAFPTGYTSTGLVLADTLARRMLEGEPDALELVRRARDDGRPGLVIVEGLTDFLSSATRCSDADTDAPAVLGVANGSWRPELAARIPDGTHVVIGTDNDDKGELYAAQIIHTLRELVASGRQFTAGRYLVPEVP